jgi:hypothetical protein
MKVYHRLAEMAEILRKLASRNGVAAELLRYHALRISIDDKRAELSPGGKQKSTSAALFSRNEADHDQSSAESGSSRCLLVNHQASLLLCSIESLRSGRSREIMKLFSPGD